MTKREKNAVFSKFKRSMIAGGAAAAILASSIVPAYAADMEVDKISEPAQEVVKETKQIIGPDEESTGKDQVTKEVAMDFTENIFSNSDVDRRAALEKQYKIQLDFSDVWEDKKGQTSVNPNGTVSEFTSHDEMKEMGFYAVNANRQELIKYAIRTGDWEPYNKYERDLLAKQEADKADKTDKVANVDKQTMKLASTTPISASTESTFDFSSVEDNSDDSIKSEPVKEAASVPSEAPTDKPTGKSIKDPTDEPAPTDKPTDKSIKEPTDEPAPTDKPTDKSIKDPTDEPVPTDKPTDKSIKDPMGVDSNDDQERRAALEDKFGITLDADDKWEDKKGETSVNPDGTVSKFTSHDEMKEMGFYAVNANRQELIQYGIRTDDWQPYRAFTALSEPAYFELVDGKLEYSKIYYAKQFETTNSDYASRITEASAMQEHDKAKELQVEKKKRLTEVAENYKAAPGSSVYVIGLNGDPTSAKEFNIPEIENEYFDSELNHPDVVGKGVYKDGKNPFTKLFQ